MKTPRFQRRGEPAAEPKPSQGNQLSVLLFDFGGTLDAEGIPWKARFFRLWREEVGEVAPVDFDRAFYDADDALVGVLPAETSLTETVGRVARGLAERLPAGKAGSAERIAARFAGEASAHLSASAALLERLATRFRLGLVSNFYGNLDAVCQGTGLTPYLSVAIDSARIGFRKPDARIFEAALAKLGARASEALFVGDSLPRDMAGARGVGIRHVWIAAGEGQPCCPADRVIRRLAELEEVLA
jgi:HAD superfamily hydrolase (TIGR01549 family)